jgi:hypothetical protein
MHFSAIFGSRFNSSSGAPAATTGTPVKSAKVKAAGRKNPRGVKISNPVLVQPTAADHAAVREIRKQYTMLSMNRCRRAGGVLERRPRVAKPKKKNTATAEDHGEEQNENEIEYVVAAANPVRVELGQLGLSPLEQLELQLLGQLAMVEECDLSY